MAFIHCEGFVNPTPDHEDRELAALWRTLMRAASALVPTPG